MKISELSKIGLTSGEIKIYKSLLDLGETTRTELAKKSGISPSKIYDVCNRLSEKGIINIVKKEGVTHFSPANPKRIHDFITQKEAEIKQEKELLDNMLPELLSKYNKTSERTDVEVFYGWEGMKTVYTEISRELGKGDENLIFGASMGKDSERADEFFAKHYLRVDKSKFKTRIIFNENVRKNKERTNYFHKSKLHEVKYLYQETFTELNLYKDIVLIVMLLEKPIVVKIKNSEAAESFKTFFNSIWKLAKK